MNVTPKPEHKDMASNSVSDETILKITKEIVVKYIEMGKISPAAFELNFKNIYTSIDKTVRTKSK
jgi:predicted transcriptional regulator